MTARKIKQFKLRFCQISEARKDMSDPTVIPQEDGKYSRNSAPIPTEQMPRRLGSRGQDFNPNTVIITDGQ